MDLKTARAFILKELNDGQWVQRASTNDFITIGDRCFYEPEMLEALELVYREGLAIQVPSSGQAQTGINFRRAERRIETGKL